MAKLQRLVAGLLVLMSGLAMAAPPPPAGKDGDITIVGQRLKQVLRDFVDSHTLSGPTDQLARWDREICPKIWGIDADQVEYVRSRIAQVAKEVGVKTGRDSCPTMLTIVISTQSQVIADSVAGDFPERSWKVIAPLRKFAQAKGPARWASVVDECGGGCGLVNTRLSKSTRPRLQAMIILIDSRRLSGVSIGQLADFLALVALSNPPMDEKRDRRSILGLFNEPDGTAAAPELTNIDLTFLDALYNFREELGVSEQRGSIVERMAKDLRRDNANAQPASPQSR